MRCDSTARCMSVVKSKRRTSADRKALYEAEKFADDMKVFIQSNIFNIKKTHDDRKIRVVSVLAKSIYKEALSVRNHAFCANKIYVKNEADRQLRREHLNNAIAELSPLCKDIEKAMEECNISSKRISDIAGQILELKTLLERWRNEEYRG